MRNAALLLVALASTFVLTNASIIDEVKGIFQTTDPPTVGTEKTDAPTVGSSGKKSGKKSVGKRGTTMTTVAPEVEQNRVGIIDGGVIDDIKGLLQKQTVDPTSGATAGPSGKKSGSKSGKKSRKGGKKGTGAPTVVATVGNENIIDKVKDIVDELQIIDGGIIDGGVIDDIKGLLQKQTVDPTSGATAGPSGKKSGSKSGKKSGKGGKKGTGAPTVVATVGNENIIDKVKDIVDDLPTVPTRPYLQIRNRITDILANAP